MRRLNKQITVKFKRFCLLTFSICNTLKKNLISLKDFLLKIKILRLLEIAALIFTAYYAFKSWEVANESKKISDDTLNQTKVDIRQRNRPFLTVKVTSPLFNFIREKDIRGMEGVEFVLIVENHGEVPAYRVSRYLFAVADGAPLFGLHVSTENLTPMNKDGVPGVKMTMDYTNNIVPPKGKAEYRFFVPKKQLLLLLDAKDKETAVLACGLKYAGALDQPPNMPYYYQENFSLWVNNDMIEIMSKGQFGN